MQISRSVLEAGADGVELVGLEVTSEDVVLLAHGEAIGAGCPHRGEQLALGATGALAEVALDGGHRVVGPRHGRLEVGGTDLVGLVEHRQDQRQPSALHVLATGECLHPPRPAAETHRPRYQGSHSSPSSVVGLMR